VVTPSTPSIRRARSTEKRKFGRCLNGTSHTLFMAFSIARITPSPPHRVSTMPTTSENVVCPLKECTFFWRSDPTTGNFDRAEVSILCCREGSWRSTIPRIVTNTRSSGKSEKNP
jgi:hypothetical protein